MRCSDCCVGEVAVMEVPLSLHEPVSVPSSFLVGLEVNDDDVPPSPTPDPATPTFAAGTFFQRGFLDCAQEALRFLVEDEGMSEDSPVVAGLQQHLLQTTPRLAPPSSLPATSTVFTFPPASPGSVIRKHHHGGFGAIHGAAGSCWPPSQSGSVRFAPYTVPSCRRVGYPGGEVGKHNPQIAASERSSTLHGVHRLPATTCTSTQRLESVLRDGVISTDDLQGVLTCLQSVQSPVEHLPPSAPPHYSHVPAPSSQPPPRPLQSPLSVPVLSCQNTVTSLDCGLNDSGYCEVSTADEVDGGSHAVVGESITVFESGSHATTNMCDNVLDCDSHRSTAACGSVFDNGCNTAHEASADMSDAGSSLTVTDTCSTESTVSTITHSHSDSSSSTDVMTQSPATSVLSTSSTLASTDTRTGGVQSSSPSSQLDLLSALSSGTHRVTAPAEEGSATASRIQSLASQILLLLQEEAEAGDDSDFDDDDEDDDDGDSTGLDSEGDDLMLEVEP